MAISFIVGNQYYNIGAGSFFKSFFSTIYCRLENNKWGSKFPVIMKKLYYGNLEASDAQKALCELDLIQRELEAFPPREVVWDYENLALKPPWGDNIAPTITSLSNYFVTNDGKDLIECMKNVFNESIRTGVDIKIQ
jgi:hypothetical protein